MQKNLNKWLLIATVFLSLLNSFYKADAQGYNPETLDKDAIRFYDKAVEYLQVGSISEGEAMLRKALDADPNYADAWLSLSGVLGESKRYQNAVDAFNKHVANDNRVEQVVLTVRDGLLLIKKKM